MNNNAKDGFLKHRKIYIGISVLAALILVAILMYGAGYRLQSNLLIGKVGTVKIEVPIPMTAIFIDESKKITTTKENETVTLSFSPREHSVIVSREGFYPWRKDFTVPSGGELRLSPVFVSQNATGQIITTRDPEYTQIRNTILKNIPPAESTPKVSADNAMQVWLEDNAIMVRNITGGTATSSVDTAKLVIQPDTIIRNVDFYKDRSDVVIFSTANSVYAIDISAEGGQNFLPIYRGQNPTFISHTQNSIYILDGENLMEVII